MLTVWGRRSSFNLQKVMWLVAELGVAHEHVELGGRFGGLDAPEFLAKNPHGTVPVIEHRRTASSGPIVVWESHAILRYLAGVFAFEGGGDLADPANRAAAEMWMDWSQTAVQPDFLMGVFWGFYRTPEPRRDMKAVNRSVAATGKRFSLLDRHLADREYVLGDALSLADIPLGTCLYRYFNLDIDRPQLPNVERWYATLMARPAYQAHVMVPFDDLFGRLDF